MEKRKDYLLWFSLGATYFLFIWNTTKVVLNNLPKLLLLIYEITGYSFSFLITKAATNIANSILSSIILVVALYKIRDKLENSVFYFIQPFLFVIGFFITFLVFENYIYSFEYMGLGKNIPKPFLNDMIINGLKNSFYLLTLLFIISNGFIKGRKEHYLIIALIVRFFIGLYSLSAFSSLVRRVSYGKLGELFVIIAFVSLYIYSSKRLYRYVIYP